MNPLEEIPPDETPPVEDVHMEDELLRIPAEEVPSEPIEDEDAIRKLLSELSNSVEDKPAEEAMDLVPSDTASENTLFIIPVQTTAEPTHSTVQEPSEIPTEEVPMEISDTTPIVIDIKDIPLPSGPPPKQSEESGIQLEERVLPSSWIHYDEHPLQKFYDPEFKSTGLGIANQMTLADANAFRNHTIEAARFRPQLEEIRKSADKADLAGIDTKPKEAGAIYILQEKDGSKFSATPLHVEIVGDDRPDLNFVFFDSFSDDLANPNLVPHPNNYFPGDAIYVTKLKNRAAAETEKILTTFDGVREPKCHNAFWKVKECYLIKRTIAEDVLTARMSREFNKGAMEQCISDGFNSIVLANKKIFHGTATTPKANRKVRADIFVPKLQPGRLLPGVLKHGRLAVLERTRRQAMDRPVQPFLFNWRNLSELENEQMNWDSLPFVKFEVQEQAFDTLAIASRIGLSGVLSMANKNKDLRYHTSVVKGVSQGQEKPIIAFQLSNISGPPRIEKWNRSTNFFVDDGNGKIEMSVDSATVVNHTLHITAIPVSSATLIVDRTRAMRSAKIVVFQEKEKNQHLINSFPTSLRQIPDDSNFKLLLRTTHGGEQLHFDEVPNGPIELKMGGINLTDPQRLYVHTVAHSTQPIIIGHSPPGVGKTSMVVVAAHVSARDYEVDGIHIATAMSNAAATALVEAFMKIEDRGQAVRVISHQNYQAINPDLRTPLDFPVLWIVEFRNYIFEVDATISRDAISDMTYAVIQHLKNAGKLEEGELKAWPLKTAFRKQHKPTMEIEDAFMRIFRPRVVFGTVASITESLNRGMLSFYAECVNTVQIDEASQVPTYALIALGVQCPTARFALIGDVKQLRPFADVDLPDDLRQFAVGDLLGAASSKVRPIDIELVRRCPYEITMLVSDLFYGGRLCAFKPPRARNDFARLLGFPSQYPIQVVDTGNFSRQKSSGKSLLNPEEAEVAMALIRRIARQRDVPKIGALSFYKAQTGHLAKEIGRLPAFVGTIDASQGQEYDVNIILTTRTSSFSSKAREAQKKEDGPESMEADFIEDFRRINVAITRTKELCILLIDVYSAVKSGVWRDVLNQIPGCACSKAADVLRWLEAEH
ncbi:hypothetical protein B9Z55_016016 [Caenorhabditis nigoni]|uniref:Uncharacterized protein n=1 Tax=Caenorhabditis nigoni TaxID=1611254 RepID=A0A2G5UDP2_9PELO|nr:hypothetical protein B9Z55_016016 [Caenorhabditis nigoni]